VYLFWEPECAALAPGRYTALAELRWAADAAAAGTPALAHYYMGYYIHTCAKMRYKAEYRPSDLLCPVTQRWVALTPALLAALDAAPFVVLSVLPGATSQPNLSPPLQLAGGGGGGSVGAATTLAGVAAASPPVPPVPPPVFSRPRGAAAPHALCSAAAVVRVPAELLERQPVLLKGQLDSAVPWGALKKAGVVTPAGVRAIETSLSAWIARAGAAAAACVYVINAG
jgi:hypothetical protein